MLDVAQSGSSVTVKRSPSRGRSFGLRTRLMGTLFILRNLSDIGVVVFSAMVGSRLLRKNDVPSSSEIVGRPIAIIISAPGTISFDASVPRRLSGAIG